MRQAIKNISDKLWNQSAGCRLETILNRSEKPFEHERADFADEAVVNSYINDNKSWFHVEYIYKTLEAVVVEPDYGYAICGFNGIVPQSVPLKAPMPSFPRYVKSMFSKRRHFPKAILFDVAIGLNYFHFFSDIINRIWLFDKIEGSNTLPVIISHRLYSTTYFQYLLQHTFLKSLNWVVQAQGEYIKVDELYISHPMPYEKAYYQKLRGLLGLQTKSDNSRRIFLNRSKSSGRYIQNFDEILPILHKYNFEVIDTGGNSFENQVSTFNSVKYLVSIHGAGNTNIIFSDPSLHFLEINPANRISGQYYWLSRTLGIAYYDVILGGNLSAADRSFRVEPAVFEAAIQKMLSA